MGSNTQEDIINVSYERGNGKVENNTWEASHDHVKDVDM